MTRDDDDYQLGPEIVRRRKLFRLSQADLATATGLNVATIRRLEKEPTESLRGSTADALEVVLKMTPGLVDKLINRTASQEDRAVVVDQGQVEPVNTFTEGKRIGDRLRREAKMSSFAKRVDPTWASGYEAGKAYADEIAVSDMKHADGMTLARATHDIGNALTTNLVFCERTPRVTEAISLVQRALNLLLAEQALPGGDV